MQDGRPRRSNRERSDSTRDALVSAARALFVEKGFAETSTPEIASAAGITRGALYHHYGDKRDLFRAVLDREARKVAGEIEAATPAGLSPQEALFAGSGAYLDAMTVPGRTRLLLSEGPAVLGEAEISSLDEAHGGRTLREGLEAAMAETAQNTLSAAVLAVLLGAAFDRAAIAIDAGADPIEFRTTMMTVLESVLARSRTAFGRKAGRQAR